MLAYLARYTHRVAISNSRLVTLDEAGVTFKWKDYRIKGRDRLKTMTLDAAEFIRRFLLHVLPPGFVKIRHFGFLANSTRRVSLALCRSLLACEQPETRPMLTDVQVRAVHRKCPACHTGTLHVIGWVAPGEALRLVARLNVDTS